MGVPVIRILFPGMEIYAVGVIVAFNFLLWTLGALLMSGEKKYVSAKKTFVNPSMIAVFSALLIIWIRSYLPEVVEGVPLTFIQEVDVAFLKFVQFLADASVPMSMFVIGIKFADIKARDLVREWELFPTTILRLVVTPLIVWLLILPFHSAGLVAYEHMVVIVITLSMPVANSAAIFAELFKKDSAFATKSILLSNLLSILTIPILMTIFGR
jgi:hypothetical protein